MVKKNSSSKPEHLKVDFEGLNRWNSILAGAYLLEAIAILVASTSKTFPVVLNFLGLDTLTTAAKGHDVLVSATHHLFDTSLGCLVALFLLVSAVTHFLAATYLRKIYEKNFAKRINSVRWVGNGISIGLLLVAVGLVSGIQDFAMLVVLFALSLGMNGLYAITEKHYQNSSSANKCTYWIGSSAGFLAWLVLVMYAWGAHIYGVGVTPYLHVVYPIIFVLFGATTVGLYFQLQKKEKWTDFVYSERVFLIINFSAQTALAWLIFAGSLRP
jgi:hypothetical protein